MTKKFDVVIGNPPYQDEAVGESTHNMPIYHQFMDAAYEVARKAVLITPARFLFDAGYTPKAWNKKMLSDPHLTVAHYVDNSDDLFPGTDIKGGIVVTYRDTHTTREPIGTFSPYPALNGVLQKVSTYGGQGSLGSVITSSRSYRYTDQIHADHPEAAEIMAAGEQYKVSTRTFEQLPFLYHESIPTDGHSYVEMLGRAQNARARRWIRSDYVTGPAAFAAYKVAVPKANGSGELGEVLSSPLVLEPNVAVTQSFITIGVFGARDEAANCLNYIKGKFSRALLGVLKVTQDNPARVWKHVPLQDFTTNSDIDWTKTIPEIDKQLYAKYGLSAEEIEFIETHVKPMD